MLAWLPGDLLHNLVSDMGYQLWGFEFAPLCLSLVWLGFSLLSYLVIDSTGGYYELGLLEDQGDFVSLECAHCHAIYAYPEASIDSADDSVECQNCAKRFHADASMDITDF